MRAGEILHFWPSVRCRPRSFNRLIIYSMSPLLSRRYHERLTGSRPGFDPRSGQVSWMRVLRGFSSSVRQMSGIFTPTGFPEYHLPITLMLIISALLEWMSEWMMCIVFNVRAVSEVAPALGWSLIRRGPPCPYVVKKKCRIFVIQS